VLCSSLASEVVVFSPVLRFFFFPASFLSRPTSCPVRIIVGCPVLAAIAATSLDFSFVAIRSNLVFPNPLPYSLISPPFTHFGDRRLVLFRDALLSSTLGVLHCSIVDLQFVRFRKYFPGSVEISLIRRSLSVLDSSSSRNTCVR